MDPQSQAFTPFAHTTEGWHVQQDVARIQQIQQEHSERLARLERRQDDDARMKSVWGNQSPFPSVLSGTPQQAPRDRFRDFDDEANNLMSSLHLDADEEPRNPRGLGAASRANSVRFDETANQNHFAHSSRSSFDFPSRNSSGLGGLQLNERSSSHKSDGRASSVHSMRSAASGRANSLNLDTGYSLGDAGRSPLDPPGLAPGVLLMGSVPAIIRCWMNTNFKHDALLYAAICTGSFKSYLDLRLIHKLGFQDQIDVADDGHARTVDLPVFFPEAVPHPASSRSSSPAPQLPTITVCFEVIERTEYADNDEDKSIQIFIGSDTLKAHNADILFSTNTVTLFDDDRSKLNIPLVRPENESTFKSLRVTGDAHLHKPPPTPLADVEKEYRPYLNGLGQNLSVISTSKDTVSPPPGGEHRPPSPSTDLNDSLQSRKLGAIGSENGSHLASARPSPSPSIRPSLSSINTRSESADSESLGSSGPVRSGSSPAIWSNWRRDTGPSTTAIAPAQSNSLDWATKRKESGMKILKPKSASRTTSTQYAAPVVAPSPGEGKSRFFDHGSRRSSDARSAVANELAGKKETQAGAAQAPAPVATAVPGSAAAPAKQKKRKLAPFALQQPSPASDPTLPDPAAGVPRFDVERLELHQTRQASSSPVDTSSPATTNSSSTATRNTSPPRFLPPHLHDEVNSQQSNGSSSGGRSPTGAFGGLRIDSMSGSENAGASVRRSASPAKRSAAAMEDGNKEVTADGQQQHSVPGSFVSSAEQPSDFDEAMKSMSTQTQETANTANGTNASTQDSDMTVTDVTSVNGDDLPAYSFEDPLASQVEKPSGRPTYDDQVRHVEQVLQKPLDEGQRGVILSYKWMNRVLARTTEGQKDSKLPKDAREGEVGPIDNLDLVPEGAFERRNVLFDVNSQPFIPLKKDLTYGEDFQILPYGLWEVVVGWYGVRQPQELPIIRYARNTAPDAAVPNIMYEVYPPIFTLRKVLPPSQQNERPPSPPESEPGTSYEKLRRRDERYKRGQHSPEDAIRLVSWRTEGLQRFLKRSKEAAGIPIDHKTKIWRVLKPAQVIVEKPGQQPPSPPASRSASPTPASNLKLIVTPEEWQKLEIGTEIEHVDAPDQTNNANYNGKSSMETFGLFDTQTLILEPPITGPAGGEHASDNKKRPKFSLLNKKGADSRPGSATTSRAQSPTPSSVMTRGRARRDGKTRGTVGLNNLGNTCYMNSALQCIRSVEELAIFFLSGKWKTQINADNPLGHNGVVAKQYHGVLEGLYSDRSGSTFNPSNFKRTLGNVMPTFSGYGQQDSQEFLSFLVDAIHEDLNRVHKKPYIENPESNDDTVKDPQAIIDLGDKFRDNHHMRNDSVAMDLFNGFYKNTMECPDCGKVSITFDPYSLVTVQLPIENTFQHPITFVPYPGKKGDNIPVLHTLDVDRNASIKTVKEVIASKHPGVDPKKLWIVEVYSGKVYKHFEDWTTVAEANIQGNDYIFCFELDRVPTNVPVQTKKRAALSFATYSTKSLDDPIPEDGMESKEAEVMAVPIYSRDKHQRSYGKENWNICRHPQYITITKEEAQDYEVILKKVLLASAQLTSRPILTEFDGEDTAFATKTATETTETDEDMTEQRDIDSKISDRSIPSEDEYVDVSIDQERPSAADANGDDDGSERQHPVIPAHFTDPQYQVSDALRNQLFTLNTAESSEGMLCTGMNSIKDNTIKPMFGRVKKPTRRASVQSSSSEESTTSSGTGSDDNADDEEGTETEDADTPASTTTNSSTTAVNAAEGDDDDSLPNDPLEPAPKKDFRNGARGRPNKFGKGKRGKKQKTYGKKDRQLARAATAAAATKVYRPVGGKSLPEPADNPYYIKIGEAIVLDWTSEASDSLFEGDHRVEDGMRGVFMSSDTGRDVQPFHDPTQDAKITARKERKRNGVTLDDCFAESSKREVLSEDNEWYCNRCKELRRATKTLEIWTAPDILVVHLKRFQGGGGARSMRDKIDVMVNYPLEGLDLTDRVGLKEPGKEYVYDLFAVDNHYGGLGGGHYTAMAKNFYDGQWYDYNDSIVSQVGSGAAKLKSAAAYLLFYRRRSAAPLGPQYLQDIVNESRNPPTDGDRANDDGADDDSDSGEGRLGGPLSSHLHGSSSAGKAGAGAAAQNPLRGGGGGPGAGNSLTQRSQTTNNDADEDEGIDMSEDGRRGSIGTLNGKALYGPVRPQHLQFGSQDEPGWSFNTLDDGNNDDDSSTRLVQSIEHDDNASSTAAEIDSLANGLDDRSQDFNNDSDWPSAGLSPFRNSPTTAYEQGEGGFMDDSGDEALHLEDAGTVGGDGEDPAPVDIRLSPGGEGDEHMKTA
ncbi:UCH-domain-containing protein [Polychaeton citri CBS 116435]|uniref:ubiquitinyl hydrolase 1 n=1 Tax=Polychaeton citri CBS 116435 TaxID=1314669 RepID=A0A9P4Q0N6_9PEZI|nr:UCH-domain-containing protein [Polychaeton citri CBS 116435]